MAQNNTIPVPSQVPLLPTVENWLADIDRLFPDNKFGLTTEADFRTAFAGAAAVFADWRHLSVKRVKGATYPVPNLDSLGLVPADYRILGMQVEAVNGVGASEAAIGVVRPPVFFTLQRNSAGDVDALLNTDPDTILTIKASYVRTSGTDEQKIASYVELPEEDVVLAAGDVYKYTFPSGETRLVEVRDQISMFNIPRPTGRTDDFYYKPYAPLASANEHAQNTDLGTNAGEFTLGLDRDFQEHGLGATVLLFQGVKGGDQLGVRYRFQNADDTGAAAYEYCFGYTGTPADVWLSHVSKEYVDVALTAKANKDTYSALAYASGISLDFASDSVRLLTLTGSVIFANAANKAQGRLLRVALFNAAASAVALSFPSGWVFLGAMPSELAAGKRALLSLECLTGSAETDIFAGYAAQA